MKNILIIGGGGREHAIGWAVSKAGQVGRLVFAPGNGGTALLPNAENVAIGAEDTEGLTRYALEQKPDLTIIGPEVPLANGLADRLREANLTVFGPSGVGAQIEASKSWAKDFMQRHGIPTSAQATFEDNQLEAALDYVKHQPGPYVIKADGLAAGKGVLVTSELAEAEHFIREALGGALFGAAGRRVLIEEYMEGVEVSVLALCDTVSGAIRALEPGCDYKRAEDNDAGPNTGGMGVYSPPAFMTAELRQRVQDEILAPALAGLQSEGIDYRGILYAGLMITSSGPRVIEFNCRFGDPETQSLLPRLKSNLLEALEATAQGRLAELPELEWLSGASVGVVLAAGGYPGPYTRGQIVKGWDSFDNEPDLFLFHAGTSRDANGQIVTNGGRVFNLVAIGENIGKARQRVYNSLTEGRLSFEGMRYRSDIAARELN